MTVSTLVRQAATDCRLEPIDLRVLVVASDELDFVEYRALKPAGLAAIARMSPTRVAMSMRRLIAAGYLDPGVTEPGSQMTFRIPFSKRPAAARRASA